MRLPGDEEEDQLSSTGEKYRKTLGKTASSLCGWLRELRLFPRQPGALASGAPHGIGSHGK